LLTGHADFEFGGAEAVQSGLLFKILNKPCPPDKLRATVQAALNSEGNDQAEEKAPDFVL
jgi:FixJ family two-component response regulator